MNKLKQISCDDHQIMSLAGGPMAGGGPGGVSMSHVGGGG